MWVIGEIDPGATIATFVGPIVAVGITLWLQARDRARERKETLLRQLLATRMNPADPLFTLSIVLVPVEFRDSPSVLTAHKDYVAATNRADSSDRTPKQDALVIAMMRALGFKTDKAHDVVREPYTSVGYATAVQLQKAALEAVPRLAGALERSAQNSDAMLQILKSSAPPK